MKKISIVAAPLYLLGQVATAQDKPNIIFILTDDQRHDAVGYIGNPYVLTPNLDSLATQGTIYNNARATNPISCASRACILTGQYSLRNGVYDFKTPLSEEQESKTYPGLLKAAGYYTGFIGKYGVSSHNPVSGGIMFDWVKCVKDQGVYYKSLMPKDKKSSVPLHPDPSEKHLTEIQGDEAIEFLRSRDSQKPFCLSISFKAPHCQDQLRGRGDEFPIDRRDTAIFKGVTFAPSLLCNDRYYNRMPKPFRITPDGYENVARVRWRYRFSSDSLYQETVRKYYSLIFGVDREVGRIVDELKRQGIDNNTVIIFMGDNGFYLGEYGMAGKWFHHEESLRIPLFVYDPRNPKGVVNEENVLNIDVAPTILSFAGLKCSSMQGRDLRKMFKRKSLYFEHAYFPNPRKAFIPKMEGVISGHDKLVHYMTADSTWYSLFRIGEQPDGDAEDIISQYPRRAKGLIRKMLRLKESNLRE